MLVPPDVIVPSRVQSGQYKGLYLLPGESSSAEICCWIASVAILNVKKTHPAKYLRINTYIPDVKAFRTHTQTLRVKIAGMPADLVSRLTPGFHDSLLPLSRSVSLAKGPVQLRLSTTIQYVPASSPGAPRYGLLLLSAYFQ